MHSLHSLNPKTPNPKPQTPKPQTLPIHSRKSIEALGPWLIRAIAMATWKPRGHSDRGHGLVRVEIPHTSRRLAEAGSKPFRAEGSASDMSAPT